MCRRFSFLFLEFRASIMLHWLYFSRTQHRWSEIYQCSWCLRVLRRICLDKSWKNLSKSICIISWHAHCTRFRSGCTYRYFLINLALLTALSYLAIKIYKPATITAVTNASKVTGFSEIKINSSSLMRID